MKVSNRLLEDLASIFIRTDKINLADPNCRERLRSQVLDAMIESAQAGDMVPDSPGLQSIGFGPEGGPPDFPESLHGAPGGPDPWHFGGIAKDREIRYGTPEQSARSAGLAWQGILENHWRMKLPEIPPHVVFLMMAAAKATRAANQSPDKTLDSYVDGAHYMKLANDVDPRNEG